MGAALLAVVTALAGGPFSLGVNAGEVTATSAFLWGRATPGPAQLLVARDPRFRRVVLRRSVAAEAARDGTIHVRVHRLSPATTYYYRFVRGRSMSAVGRFETAPPAGRSATIRFAWSGDADATQAPPGTARPAWNNFDVYGRMAAEHNDFNINLGDTIYSDSEVGTPPALTLTAKWTKYRLNLSLRPLPVFRGATGVCSHWDDHEFVNDFSTAEFGNALYSAGREAFLDFAPVNDSASDGIYRSFRWGRNLQLFFLDERSFRSAKASAGGTCNGSDGSPDLAPTAPPAVRAAFAALIPSLATPPPPACLDRIRDPSRTMLGAHQLARFKAEIIRSNATFKVIVNEVPIQQFYALPYDRWEGYAAERESLLRFLQANVKNVVFLTTDTHANFVNDARLQTLEPGGPVDSGITEVVTGPVATRTFAKEIDTVTGKPGSGILISGLFLKPPPPRGVGMQCVSPDVYSYGEVSVTASSLTITPKDSHGAVVNDITGEPCKPVVIPAR